MNRTELCANILQSCTHRIPLEREEVEERRSIGAEVAGQIACRATTRPAPSFGRCIPNRVVEKQGSS